MAYNPARGMHQMTSDEHMQLNGERVVVDLFSEFISNMSWQTDDTDDK